MSHEPARGIATLHRPRGRSGCRSRAPISRQAIVSAGASRRFLPAYSPDLNSIEPVFAKLKSLLRKMAPRSVDALWKALGSITGCVSPEECRNFIRHAG
jgi:transposase